jgi:hypothetical protein
MARPRQKNLVTRLADAGEEAIQRLADAPGADRLVGAMTSMRDRMDDMQKRLRGLEDLDRRVRAVEQRLDKLERGKGASSTRRVAATTARRSSTKKKESGDGGRSRSRTTGTRRQTGES